MFECSKEEVMEETRRIAFKEGFIVGFAETKAKEMATAVLHVLQLFGEVPEYVQERIEKETNFTRQEEWLKIAVRAGSMDKFLDQSGLTEYRNGLGDGMARAVLEILKLRWDVPESVQKAVLVQYDLSLLLRWLQKAIEEEMPEELFKEIRQKGKKYEDEKFEKIKRELPQKWKQRVEEVAEEAVKKRTVELMPEGGTGTGTEDLVLEHQSGAQPGTDGKVQDPAGV